MFLFGGAWVSDKVGACPKPMLLFGGPGFEARLMPHCLFDDDESVKDRGCDSKLIKYIMQH